MSQGHEVQDMDDRSNTDNIGHITRPFSLPNPDAMSQIEEEQSEDDNEIELELTMEYMANGHSDMKSKEYTAAEENFRSALELAEEHDLSNKLGYGPGNITLVLADCLSIQNKEEEALEVLEPVADGSFNAHHSDKAVVRAGNAADDSRDQFTQFKACHNMGIIFLKKADTQAAEKRAQQAFKGRRKICGPHDSATLESVQLLIDIFTANNDKTRARAYRRFLEPVKTKAFTGSDTSVRAPAALPLQPSAPQTIVAATLTAPLPSIPGRTDAVTEPSIIPTPLGTEDASRGPTQSMRSATASTSLRGSLSSTGTLANIAEIERVPKPQEHSVTELEHHTTQLSGSIRGALQAAASVPSSSSAQPFVLPPVGIEPSRVNIHPLVTTTVPVLPPINSLRYASQAPSTAGTSLNIVSPIDIPGSTDYAPLPTPAALPVGHSFNTSRSTPSPPAALSASQAALPTVFAEADGKPPRRSSAIAPEETPTTYGSQSIDATITSSLPVRQPSPVNRTPAPLIVSSTSAVQSPAEIPLTNESTQQKDAPISSRTSSQTSSWFTDTNLTAPLCPTRVTSSQANAPEAAIPERPDTAFTEIGQAASTKRRNWSVPFSRSKTDRNMKKQAALSPQMLGSVAPTHAASHTASLSTIPSTAEARRSMSLISSIGSQSMSYFDKEFSLGGDNPPRPSMSRSHTSASEAPLRTLQQLAPRFASIKSLRAEGKKSASINAAMKLLREYDPEQRILNVRERELRANMKESHKGLASTGYGYAPIHLFCDQKTEAVVEVDLLIEQGVDVNAVACKPAMPGHEPFTPLQRAIEYGHTEIVRLLVEADVAIAPPTPQKGAPNRPVEVLDHPLLIACTKGHTEIVHVLLQAGGARMVKDFPQRHWHGNSLLHEACWLADTTMVKMLLDYLKKVKSQHHFSSGPDFESGIIGAPGQQDQFGATPIMYAIDLRDCTSQDMRVQKSGRRKDCLRLLLEHDIHGDLHSQKYRDNIARVLSTKWTRGPGKGHSIFCYSDEAGDEELTHLLDPFRYQVSPDMRCHATPQCMTLNGSSIYSGSMISGGTDRQSKLPEFSELMSTSGTWPVSPVGSAARFELAGGHVERYASSGFGNSTVSTSVGSSVEAPNSSRNVNGNAIGPGSVTGPSELASETSRRSKE